MKLSVKSARMVSRSVADDCQTVTVTFRFTKEQVGSGRYNQVIADIAHAIANHLSARAMQQFLRKLRAEAKRKGMAA